MTTIATLPDFVPFTRTDWYGFAGAEPWSDISPPLTCDMGHLKIILDRSGPQVFSSAGDGEDCWTMPRAWEVFSPAQALRLGRMIQIMAWEHLQDPMAHPMNECLQLLGMEHQRC